MKKKKGTGTLNPLFEGMSFFIGSRFLSDKMVKIHRDNIVSRGGTVFDNFDEAVRQQCHLFITGATTYEKALLDVPRRKSATATSPPDYVKNIIFIQEKYLPDSIVSNMCNYNDYRLIPINDDNDNHKNNNNNNNKNANNNNRNNNNNNNSNITNDNSMEKLSGGGGGGKEEEGEEVMDNDEPRSQSFNLDDLEQTKPKATTTTLTTISTPKATTAKDSPKEVDSKSWKRKAPDETDSNNYNDSRNKVAENVHDGVDDDDKEDDDDDDKEIDYGAAFKNASVLNNNSIITKDNDNNNNNNNTHNIHNRGKTDDSDADEDTDEEDEEKKVMAFLSKSSLQEGRTSGGNGRGGRGGGGGAAFACQRGASGAPFNHNKHITDKLEELATIYKGDQGFGAPSERNKNNFRLLNITRAIKKISSLDHLLTLNELPNHRLGKKTEAKIAEIIRTGDLEKVRLRKLDERIITVNLFTKVHGIGGVTAHQLYDQGFRTIEQLRKASDKLPRTAQIGLKYYEELQERMCRGEVEEILARVRESALTVAGSEAFRDLEVTVCGSYRRGKPTCGDVDILITHPKPHVLRNLLVSILKLLHDSHFLTDDLADHVNVSDEGSETYMGICQLPGPNRLHRRIDIKVYPPDQYAFALLYFTGSAIFNRSMRAYGHKKNLRLSDHCLMEVKRQGGKSGDAIAVKKIENLYTEKDIFDYLGLKYLEPAERDI